MKINYSIKHIKQPTTFEIARKTFYSFGWSVIFNSHSFIHSVSQSVNYSFRLAQKKNNTNWCIVCVCVYWNWTKRKMLNIEKISVTNERTNHWIQFTIRAISFLVITQHSFIRLFRSLVNEIVVQSIHPSYLIYQVIVFG